ncbi:hypothetical protein [Symbioplanes lichenis]|uniref:hypothetical protein n=1 Tax=Symbioplanes lichenis TaxID=1629072 RepID=UPI00273926F8|nr:hypothetical protein [Actinoplanes lichenis]
MRTAKTLATVAVAVGVALGGSVYAFAGWSAATPAAVLRMRTAEMPAGAVPSVAKAGKNAVVTWAPSILAAGVRAQHYTVIRTGAGGPVVVCPEVTTTTCRDVAVPGGTWSWQVRPAYEHWVGDLSGPSVPLTFAGPPEVAAVARMGSPSSSPLPSTKPSASPAVTSTPTVSPPSAPSPDPVDEEPSPSAVPSEPEPVDPPLPSASASAGAGIGEQ